MTKTKLLNTIIMSIMVLSAQTIFAQNWSNSGSNFTLSNANGTIGTSTNHSLKLNTNNLSRFYIDANGKTGIGVDQNRRMLHIHGTTPILAEQGSQIPPPPGTESLIVITNTESGNTAWDGLRIGLQGSVAQVATVDKIRLDISNGQSLLSFKGDGKITMFTAGLAYDAKFGINTPFSNGMFIDNSNNGTGYSLRVKVNNSDTEAYSLINGVSTKFVVKGDGRVGIGTGSPDSAYLLDVAGKARACEVRVNNPGWCDFVFEPNYQLMSIEELKSYLSKNKHLPEMPSEAQVIEEGGFDLAQMNVSLLKRSEENTLYIIQLQEEINELKKLVSLQTELIDVLMSKK